MAADQTTETAPVDRALEALRAEMKRRAELVASAIGGRAAIGDRALGIAAAVVLEHIAWALKEGVRQSCTSGMIDRILQLREGSR